MLNLQEGITNMVRANENNQMSWTFNCRKVLFESEEKFWLVKHRKGWAF